MRIQADWLTAAHSCVVMDALGGQGFFVGGCVRNTLLNVPVADIDVATPLEPDAVQERLQEAGVKTIPTGLQHDTVTAVHQGVPIEITTFRRDVETDGRHAQVAFTREIAQDAARRDFTMNALYADRDGTIIDPLGGLPDLEARSVRFIGDAGDRIREDYLRILRFFRFHAWYGADRLDSEGLAACAELAEGIETLARERIGWEFRKLLSAVDPAPAVAAMSMSGILARCLEGAVATALAPLVHLEQDHGVKPDWRRRLVALGGQEPTDALRLSRAETRSVQALRDATEHEPDSRIAAYRHGTHAARSAALIRAASTGMPLSPDLETDLKAGAQAEFPLKPQHLMACGVQPGPALGEFLRQAEDRWIASGFSLDKDTLLADLIN